MRRQILLVCVSVGDICLFVVVAESRMGEVGWHIGLLFVLVEVSLSSTQLEVWLFLLGLRLP